MRRLSRSMFVLYIVVAAVITPALYARNTNDDQDPRDSRNVPRIVKVIKQIIRSITKPTDDGSNLLPPHP